MPDDGYRREVIGGALVVTPSPVGRHQRCVTRLSFHLQRACPADLEVIVSPYDWRPPSGESFQPDLMVIRRADFDPDGPLRATPLLIVEVLSASNAEQDRAVKRARYEALGVPAYWIVDPVTPAISALRRNVRGRYVEAARASRGQPLVVDFPFAVELTPAELIGP